MGKGEGLTIPSFNKEKSANSEVLEVFANARVLPGGLGGALLRSGRDPGAGVSSEDPIGHTGRNCPTTWGAFGSGSTTSLRIKELAAPP